MDRYQECWFYSGPNHYYNPYDYDCPPYGFSPSVTSLPGELDDGESAEERMQAVDSSVSLDTIEEEGQSSTCGSPTVVYSLSVVNPQKKSEYSIRKMRKWPKFASVEQLQQTIRDVLDAGNKTVEIGYIESGHGMKGKKRWIFEDNDLEEMYEHYKGGREILMWCYDPKVDIPCSRKQRRSSCEGSTKATTNSQVSAKRSTYDNHQQKMSEVEDIYGKLSEKHAQQYKPEQLRVWAHMVQMKKHSSLDHPPKKRFFKSTCKGDKSPIHEDGDDSSQRSSISQCGVSPAKRVVLRGHCIDQLQKWLELREKGGISEAQYEEFKKNIISDIQQF